MYKHKQERKTKQDYNFFKKTICNYFSHSMPPPPASLLAILPHSEAATEAAEQPSPSSLAAAAAESDAAFLLTLLLPMATERPYTSWSKGASSGLLSV